MVSASVLNGRIYRAACLPVLLALAIAGFSLSNPPAPLSSSLAPEAFQGERVESDLQALSEHFPDRRPGGTGDQALANAVAEDLRALGGAAHGGFTVTEHAVSAQTIDGERTLTTVVAQRPGTTAERPIVVLARRDAATEPADSALSATAVLLELARVFSTSETRRGIVLVSTSGGSGGNAGARYFAANAAQWVGGPLDAAIVLGDLGGSAHAKLFLGSFADAPGTAPQLLQSTVAQALRQQVGIAPLSASLPDRLAQASFPLPGGEQAPLNAAGLPAVMLQVGGELPPAAAAPPSEERLQGVGRTVLAAVYALDVGPNVESSSAAPETALVLQRKLLPAWAVRLLVATLLLPPLLTAGDGLARQRRRRLLGAGQPLARWVVWVFACALPFFASAVLAIVLGALGVFATPCPPVAPTALPLKGSSLAALLLVVAALALGWGLWSVLMRRLALPLRPQVDPAGLALVIVLVALAAVVWAFNPYTALLLVPASHLWLLLVEPQDGSSIAARSPGRLVLVALGALPLALLIAFYAHHLGLGIVGVAHTALLLLAGGRIGLIGAALWSVALGVLVAVLAVALAAENARAPDRYDGDDDPMPPPELPSIRGPMSYAGPGSLGGTESALPH